MFNKEVLLFVLIGIALGASRTHSKLERKTNYKIIGGDPANITDFPWQVSIAHDLVFACGGFLVAPGWVVTAGSCIYDTSSKLITVRVGSNYRDHGGKVFDISQKILNPNFDSLTLDNDICLLRLWSPVDPSLGSAIELPKAGQPVPDNSSLVVTGYGRVSYDGDLSAGLLKVTIPTINHQKCVDAYGPFIPVVGDNMFCAGVLDEGGKDACQGDEGSPAVLDGKAVGIVSWRYEFDCARPGYPGVYTQVSKYVEWINQYVKL